MTSFSIQLFVACAASCNLLQRMLAFVCDCNAQESDCMAGFWRSYGWAKILPTLAFCDQSAHNHAGLVFLRNGCTSVHFLLNQLLHIVQ